MANAAIAERRVRLGRRRALHGDGTAWLAEGNREVDDADSRQRRLIGAEGVAVGDNGAGAGDGRSVGGIGRIAGTAAEGCRRHQFPIAGNTAAVRQLQAVDVPPGVLVVVTKQVVADLGDYRDVATVGTDRWRPAVSVPGTLLWSGQFD